MTHKYRVQSSIVPVGDAFRVDVRATGKNVYGAREETVYFTTAEKAQAYIDGLRAGFAIIDALVEE